VNAAGDSLPATGTLTIAAPSAVSLTANKTTPQTLASAGTIIFTATASGGTGPYEYKFSVKGPGTGGVFVVVQNYGDPNGNQYPWTPSLAGDYIMEVLARNQGSTAAYQTFKQVPFTITSASAATSVTLVANKVSPQALATVGTVRFTATAAGGTGPYEYQFLLKGPSTGNVWVSVQNYGDPNGNLYDWVPSQAGTYLIQVNARVVGSAAVYEAFTQKSFTITTGTVATSVTLVPNKQTPQSIATSGTIVFTATASGGTGPYEYKFLLKGPSTGNLWSTVQNYGDPNWNLYNWTPAQTGYYIIMVYARTQGSTAAYEVFRQYGFTINP